MADKRAAKKRIKRLPLVFLHESGEHRGRSSNLSKTGIYVKTRKPLEPDSPIMIILKTDEDNGSVLELNGRVVRKIKRRPSHSCNMFVTLNNGMGVRLINTPREYYDLIAGIHQAPVAYNKPKTH